MYEQERSWGKISKMPSLRLNNSYRRRLNWKHMEPQGGSNVIKGLSHRVIVVKSPDERYFEEAIFVIRDDVLSRAGADSETVLKEARRIANAYVKNSTMSPKRFYTRLPAPLFAAAGAAATGIAWLTARLCGI